MSELHDAGPTPEADTVSPLTEGEEGGKSKELPKEVDEEAAEGAKTTKEEEVRILDCKFMAQKKLSWRSKRPKCKFCLKFLCNFRANFENPYKLSQSLKILLCSPPHIVKPLVLFA